MWLFCVYPQTAVKPLSEKASCAEQSSGRQALPQPTFLQSRSTFKKKKKKSISNATINPAVCQRTNCITRVLLLLEKFLVRNRCAFLCYVQKDKRFVSWHNNVNQFQIFHF